VLKAIDAAIADYLINTAWGAHWDAAISLFKIDLGV
jgi:hypothetical protein